MNAIEACIYCSSGDDLTRDHVPPKGLFPTPAPSNLITVPSCKRCNQSFSKAEEYFRVIVTSISGAELHSDAIKLFREKILPGLQRRPKLASKVISTVIPVDEHSASGRSSTKFAHDLDRPEVDNIICKILRGLLYAETDLTLPKDYDIKWGVITGPSQLPTELLNAIMSRPIHTFGTSIFRYRVYWDPPTPLSFWLFSFYDVVLFHGSILPRSGIATSNGKLQRSLPTGSLRDRRSHAG